MSSPENQEVICSVCLAPLTDKTSMAAGMGPTCRDRIRFAETCSRADIAKFCGPRTLFLPENFKLKTAIVQLKGESEPRLVTLLPYNDPEVIALFDRTELAMGYNQAESSFSDAFMSAYKEVPVGDVSFLSDVTNPEDQEMLAAFSSFQEKYKEEIKTRPSDDDSSSFLLVKESKKLTKEIQNTRKDLSKKFKSDEGDFKTRWLSGEFGIATLVARLETAKISGAMDLAAALRFQYPQIKIEDYGLTDAEILAALEISVKPIEKRIFSCLIKGKSDLVKLTSIYKMINENKSAEAIKEFLEFTDRGMS